MNAASTSTVQAPQMTFDPSTLPITHLVSLRSKLSQIIESLSTLTHLISGDDMIGAGPMGMGMASWPDILAKYNNLLAQSHTLINTLSGAHLPQPARRPGEARKERGNPYEGIVLHPFLLPDAAGTVDEAQQGMLENLFRTEPHPEVIKRWDATVRRFVERRKGGGGPGTMDTTNASKVVNIVVGVDPVREAQDIVKEMTAVKEGHDARIERAMRVVDELKERWDWKMRVGVDGDVDGEDLFGDDENDSVNGKAGGMLVDSGDEAMGTQTQSMLGSQSQRNPTVYMDTATQQSRMETQGSVVTQPPPPSQEIADDEEDMFSASEDDDDDDLEDVMED
jgi:hypothetical protein